jgi:hypothetical protein
LLASQRETNGGWNDVINVFGTFRGEVGEREASRTTKESKSNSLKAAPTSFLRGNEGSLREAAQN